MIFCRRLPCVLSLGPRPALMPNRAATSLCAMICNQRSFQSSLISLAQYKLDDENFCNCLSVLHRSVLHRFQQQLWTGPAEVALLSPPWDQTVSDRLARRQLTASANMLPTILSSHDEKVMMVLVCSMVHTMSTENDMRTLRATVIVFSDLTRNDSTPFPPDSCMLSNKSARYPP